MTCLIPERFGQGDSSYGRELGVHQSMKDGRKCRLQVYMGSADTLSSLVYRGLTSHTPTNGKMRPKNTT